MKNPWFSLPFETIDVYSLQVTFFPRRQQTARLCEGKYSEVMREQQAREFEERTWWLKHQWWGKTHIYIITWLYVYTWYHIYIYIYIYTYIYIHIHIYTQNIIYIYTYIYRYICMYLQHIHKYIKTPVLRRKRWYTTCLDQMGLRWSMIHSWLLSLDVGDDVRIWWSTVCRPLIN